MAMREIEVKGLDKGQRLIYYESNLALHEAWGRFAAFVGRS